MREAVFAGSQALFPCLPQPSSSALSVLPSPSLLAAYLPGLSSGGQGFDEGKLSGEVVAVGVLAGAFHPAALGFLGVIQLLPAQGHSGRPVPANTYRPHPPSQGVSGLSPDPLLTTPLPTLSIQASPKAQSLPTLAAPSSPVEPASVWDSAPSGPGLDPLSPA